jgi:hypothetical protein
MAATHTPHPAGRREAIEAAYDRLAERGDAVHEMTEPDVQSEIADLLTQLARERMQLAELVDVLTGRLAPITRSLVARVDEKPVTSGDARSPIGEQLVHEIDSIHTSSNRLSDLMESLAI